MEDLEQIRQKAIDLENLQFNNLQEDNESCSSSINKKLDQIEGQINAIRPLLKYCHLDKKDVYEIHKILYKLYYIYLDIGYKKNPEAYDHYIKILTSKKKKS